MKKILFVIGSTRPIRLGKQLAGELSNISPKNSDIKIEIVDLKEVDLPFLNEPKMPSLQLYEHAHSKNWAKLINDADGYIFLTPQYNGGYPAPLKNAVDYCYHEWKNKPAAIISYGSRGGFRASKQLREVLTYIGLDVCQTDIQIITTDDLKDNDGLLTNPTQIVEGYLIQLNKVLNELLSKLT